MHKIDFEITQNGYTLKDSIVLSDHDELTEAEVEALKQKRFDDWYAVITAPPLEIYLDMFGAPLLDRNGEVIFIAEAEADNYGE